MEKTFYTIKAIRENFLKLISDLSIESLNEIPEGFNNNIIWNLGHIIASQQIICYELTDNIPLIESQYISDYRNGTKPERFINNTELEVMKSNLLSTIDRTEIDLLNNLFENFKVKQLQLGLKLERIQDSLNYVPVHDATHLGYSLALKRIIKH
ncbi:DinB family protein [Arcticibacter eurypsychrophilus]|uniref:DinB family protein n=1 Tax=Arcticibacter eurypsychrophilus TaxID=1434752 RepID=UPI00084D5F17|nr:DinB family protein [Arcticibacter eurypsychrophilus]